MKVEWSLKPVQLVFTAGVSVEPAPASSVGNKNVVVASSASDCLLRPGHIVAAVFWFFCLFGFFFRCCCKWQILCWLHWNKGAKKNLKTLSEHMLFKRKYPPLSSICCLLQNTIYSKNPCKAGQHIVSPTPSLVSRVGQMFLLSRCLRLRRLSLIQAFTSCHVHTH